MDNGKEIYVVFVDIEKAFDRVKQIKIVEILIGKSLDWQKKNS